MTASETVLVVGAGNGLSAAVARRFSREGARLYLAARRTDKLSSLCAETGATAIPADAGSADAVASLFARLDADGAVPDLVLYNPSRRARGPLVELDPDAVAESLRVTAFGGFLVAQAAAKRMLPRGHGSIFFTGASASVKGYALSAPFAMGKFALRGLAQSLARELSPQGLHIAHFVIDGGIRQGPDDTLAGGPDSLLEPEAIAETYWQIHRQHRSAWTWEVELRPWVERF